MHKHGNIIITTAMTTAMFSTTINSKIIRCLLLFFQMFMLTISALMSGSIINRKETFGRDET